MAEGPNPGTRDSSSTEENGPRASRSCKIAAARAGPIPGSLSSSETDAELRFRRSGPAGTGAARRPPPAPVTHRADCPDAGTPGPPEKARWGPMAASIPGPIPGTRSSPSTLPKGPRLSRSATIVLASARPTSGEPGQLTGRRLVGIDPLVGAQRTGQGEHAVPVGCRRLGRHGGQQLDLTRGLARPGDPPAEALPREAEREEQEERAAFGG